MSDELKITEAWNQYEQGVNYKTRIGLYSDVDKNERIYADKHWENIPHDNLPTPIIPVIKRGLSLKIAAVADKKLKLHFSAIGQTENDDIKAYLKQINEYSDVSWERLKMDYLNLEVLKDAAITGDGILYFPWNPDIKTGQDVTGDFDVQIVDNVNYYPGNPNTPDVQGQPYIILTFRELVKNLKKEAERNKAKKEEIELIVADADTEHTAGDMGKLELDDSSKCTVLLKFWKEDGTVYMEKATRAAVVMPKKKTKLTRYPIAMMNWDTRKNCCHGVSEITGLVSNQIFINKMTALAQLAMSHLAFPEKVYDGSRIDDEDMLNHKIGDPIRCKGDPNGAIHVVSPATMSLDIWRGIETIKDTTFEMMGATTALRGDINDPDNTSALMAVRDASLVPLKPIQQRHYAMLEDCGLIWLDYMKGYYAGRQIPVKAELEVTGPDGQPVFDQMGNPVKQETIVYVPMPNMTKYELVAKIDVGPSTTWSEIQTVQTMDNLMGTGKIPLSKYLERVGPIGLIPDWEKLAQWAKDQESKMEMMQQQAAMMPQGVA